MKRVFDIALVSVALIFAAPLLLLVALAVWLERTGPIFYIQERVGLHGRIFSLVKFRSMAVGSDQYGFSTVKGDPRVTRVGKFIRKWSLDELPQLWNVLKGDMSFVGPRPDVPAQKELYSNDDWALRCSVRPGITGEAQVQNRSNFTIEERRRVDLDYVKTSWSPLNDLRILLATFSKIKSW